MNVGTRRGQWRTSHGAQPEFWGPWVSCPHLTVVRETESSSQTQFLEEGRDLISNRKEELDFSLWAM